MTPSQKAAKKYYSTRSLKPIKKDRVKEVTKIVRKENPQKAYSETGCIEFALNYFISTHNFIFDQIKKQKDRKKDGGDEEDQRNR